MPSTATLRLTPGGTAKLQGLKRVLRTAALEAVYEGAVMLRAEAAKRAPTQREEGQLVSEGVAANGAVLGTTEGRYLPSGSGIQAAILADTIDATTAPFGAVAGVGHASEINRETAFSWSTKTRGVQGPTLPANGHLLETLEDGGAWSVYPRTKYWLEPQDGFAVPSMTKTAQPRRMFQGAALAWVVLSGPIVAKLRAAFQVAGRA